LIDCMRIMFLLLIDARGLSWWSTSVLLVFNAL
jgi:hypothetical protein